MAGLRNRFSKETRQVWELDWFACMVCGMNQWDAVHHIISPSSREYINGKHNESILNSCPIHNYRHPNAEQYGIKKDCHINNEVWLNSHIPELLEKTRTALSDLGYELKPIDLEFIEIYSHLYGSGKRN